MRKILTVGAIFLLAAIATLPLVARGGAADQQSPDQQSPEPDQPPIGARIDRLVQPYIDSEIVVGLVVGAIQGDQTIVRGYGRVERGGGDRPNGRTVYEIGSISKTFTGILLADAVVDGRVRLDQPIEDLLPADVPMPRHADGPIRLRDLATHTSGLPRMPDNLAPTDPSNPYADYGKEDLYAFLRGHELSRGPATKQEYSNLAFGLLGQVLADQAGVTYGELMRTTIAVPMGMEDTGVEFNESMRARLAPPYDADLGEERNWDFQAFAGAGAIRSTADDMLRYAGANLEPPAGELGEAIELAWQIHQPPLKKDDFAMGFGWHVARDGVTRWHNGQTGGYHSMLLVNRPHNVAVVVLSNTATSEVDALAEQIARMLMGVAEQPREFEATVDVAPEQMQRLVGRYRLAPEFILTVKIDGGKLLVGATGQPFLRVFPRSDTEWSYRVVDASLTFEMGDAGPAQAVVLHQNGLDQRAARVEPELPSD